MTPSRGSSSWQEAFIADLESIVRSRSELVVIRERHKPSASGEVLVQLGLRTTRITHEEGGLVLEPTETVEVTVPDSPFRPPSVHVTHRRFVGYPHVLNGLVLCVYLDVSREWNPNDGAAGFLNRLWGWFEAAAGAKFDPHTALFHAVGGTDHAADSTPIVVIRDELDAALSRVSLSRRTNHRFDLALDDIADSLRTPLIAAPAPLPLGTGTTVSQLGLALDDPTMSRGGNPAPGLLPRRETLRLMLVAAAKRNPDTSPQPFVLSVPHPAGGAPHVLIGALTPDTADAFRADGDAEDPKIEWWRVSDERASVTTRRDSTRPAAAFAGRSVMIFGCGGLGSWIAEFVARAGAKRIMLTDSAIITGGLLVRQNYEEGDVGATKESALATRLRAINDGLVVDIFDASVSLDIAAFDLVVDASVNLALSQALATIAPPALTAQVAVDPRTASVGMVLIKPAGCAQTLAELDERAGAIVSSDPSLEDYHSMWSPSTHGQLIPTRGCSVPTFHGSAADLAAAAGVMVSMLGQQLVTPTASVHLFTLPHAASPQTRASVFVQLG